MKKTTLLLCALLVFGLTGCGADNGGSDGERMTQPIVTGEADGALSQSGAVEAGGSRVEQPASGEDVEELKARLYAAKAEKEAVEIDMDNLEADYRVGKIGTEDFQQRKGELAAREAELDLEEDELKQTLRRNQINGHISELAGETDLPALMERLQQVELEDSALELEEDALELQYRKGEISREDYIRQQAEYEKKSDELEDLEDALEERLEQLGWDD